MRARCPSVIERVFTGEISKWVGCQYPTPALAQDAGMSSRAFEDFLYGACLLDWDAERERMSRYAERFDAADEVRIVGAETDLTLSISRSDRGRRRGRRQHAGRRVLLLTRSRTRPKGRSRSSSFPRPTPGARCRESGCGSMADASSTLRPRPRAFPDRTARHRRRRSPPRRARDRLQSRHHALHEEHALRREDRRHRPPRAGQRPSPGWRDEREPDPLGHRQGPAPGGQIFLDGEVVQQDGEPGGSSSACRPSPRRRRHRPRA